MLFNRKPKPNEPLINRQWEPPADPVFQYLLEEAALGWVPMYFAAIPLPRVCRFDPKFRPETTPDGDKVVAQIMERWRAGEFNKIWVYPKGDLFIASDDYFTLAAAEKGQPDKLPCWVLGEVRNPAATQVQGPIAQADIKKMLGLT